MNAMVQRVRRLIKQKKGEERVSGNITQRYSKAAGDSNTDDERAEDEHH